MSLRCPRVITRLVIFTSENGQGKNRNRNAIPPRLRPKILVTTTSEFRTNKMIVETGNFFFFVFQSHVLFALVGKFHRGHLGGGGGRVGALSREKPGTVHRRIPRPCRIRVRFALSARVTRPTIRVPRQFRRSIIVISVENSGALCRDRPLQSQTSIALFCSVPLF